MNKNDDNASISNASGSHNAPHGSSHILRELYQAEVGRLRRLYSALSQINQIVVQLPPRTELFENVCKTLVEKGGFRMAWVGWKNQGSVLLTPVASWGDDENLIDTVEVYIDQCPHELGPIGIAFQENRSIISNDFLHASNTIHWREVAQNKQLRSGAAFPIRLNGKVSGILSVYSNEKNFFKDAETKLLEGASKDISFALDNLQREMLRLQAEKKARSESAFSKTMLDSMPGIVYLYDEDQNFLRWNRNFQQVSGYTDIEIANLTPLDFFSEEDSEIIQARIKEVFESGESSIEGLFLTKHGNKIPYFFTGRRVMLEGKKCLVGMGVDISNLKETQRALNSSEALYRTTLDNIIEGCQIIGFDWRYKYLNPAAERAHRRPNSELLGKTMMEAFPGIDKLDIFRMIKRCMEKRIPHHDETEFTFPDGRVAWFDVRSHPIPEGIFILSIDITDRKLAEKQLRQLNETLEVKVAERVSELQIALEMAESADRIKSTFLATMSHELRTPLNSIIGFTGIILQGLAGPLNPEQTKQLSMVKGSAQHLLALINDILDLSKLEAGQLQVYIEPFNLRKSIEHMLELIQPQATKKNIALTSEIAPEIDEIISDRRRIEQILLNLLSNAIKFTAAGSVQLRAQIEQLTDHSTIVRICVTNSGIGISQEDLATLFQPFRQIDTGITRQHDGTGLGLSICRQLAYLLGGEISATSVTSQGSTFCFSLPLSKRINI